jgi:inhibitor of KinA
MKFVPLGDSALLVRLRDDWGEPNEALALVRRAWEGLNRAALPGVTELTPSYTSVALFFDPAIVARYAGDEAISEWLIARVAEVLRRTKSAPRKDRGKVLEIPVCYEREFGLDLGAVAEHARVSESEIVQRHTAAEYHVHCLGFMPGFPYLSGLPRELAMPRRTAPRTNVPMGSVAIGGEQTGIYPQTSPGGWNVIGRTPWRLFDVHHEPPALLQMGDRVRFRAIKRAEFEALAG